MTTGSGTQTDPYVVDTWNDLKTACTKDNAFIKIADNQDWDLNELDNKATVLGNWNTFTIDGNGATIRNWYAEDNMFIGRPTVENLTIRDFYVNGMIANSGQSGSAVFNNCKLAGIINNGQFASYNVRFDYCSVNIIATGYFNWGSILVTPSINSVHTDFTIDTQGSGGTAYSGMLQNVAVYGNMNIGIVLGQFSKCVVLDCKMPPEKVGIESYTSSVLINTEKCSATGNSLIPVTTAEMLDENALIAKGFPIGVDVV